MINKLGRRESSNSEPRRLDGPEPVWHRENFCILDICREMKSLIFLLVTLLSAFLNDETRVRKRGIYVDFMLIKWEKKKSLCAFLLFFVHHRCSRKKIMTTRVREWGNSWRLKHWIFYEIVQFLIKIFALKSKFLARISSYHHHHCRHTFVMKIMMNLCDIAEQNLASKNPSFSLRH